MHLRTAIVALVFLFPICAYAQIQGLGFVPAAPTAGDAVVLVSCYGAGPYVETVEVSRTESSFVIRFVQDGFDFSPNPPHCAEAELGELTAGTYEVTVIRDPLSFPPRQDTLSLVVAPGAPPALPAPLLVPISPVALIFILVGVACGAWRAVHNYVFKPTADDLPPSSGSLPRSGGLTRR